MHLEHIAFNVAEPAAMAAWYAEHLNMELVVANDEPPYVHFLSDGAGSMLEFYRRSEPHIEVPDYASIDPLVLHIAFATDDIETTRARLIEAGATPEGDITTTSAGDKLAFLRDPWNVTIQLVTRAASDI